MNKLEFLHTPFEKLEWIISRHPNPKRSQIHPYLTFVDHQDVLIFDDSSPFFLNKHQTVYYDQLANDIMYELENGVPIDIYEELIEYMYDDILQNNMWGFVIDW